MMEDSNLLVSVSTYKETEYKDASFEIVGTPPSEDGFVPMPMKILERNQREMDPMFFDFGGRRPEDSQMWHLPETEEYKNIDRKQKAEEQKAIEIEERNNEIEEARQQGYLQGLEESKIAAQLEYQEKIQQVQSQMNQIMQDMQNQIIEQLKYIEKSAVSLAVSLSEKIINHAVEINPEYILPVIEEALSLTGGAVVKKVRVSPDDFEFISVVGTESISKAYDGSWEFVADDTIKAGCVVETSAGEVEYDIDKAWERTKSAVTAVLK